MIGGDGINDESNKTAPLPLRNIARNITQRIGSPNACLLNLVLLYQRAFRLRSSGNITTNRMTATIAVSRSAMACAAITP